MSHSHESHATENQDQGYGGDGRSARPLVALVPIGLAIAVCLAMLAEGLHVMTTPADTAAGEAHIAQTAVPASGAGGAS